MDSDGMDCLPLIIADKKIISEETYLSKDGLAKKNVSIFFSPLTKKKYKQRKVPVHNNQSAGYNCAMNFLENSPKNLFLLEKEVLERVLLHVPKLFG